MKSILTKRSLLLLIAVIAALSLTVSCNQQKSKKAAFEQNKKLGRGINILSPDVRWTDPKNARFTEKHFKLIKEGGFDNVRIVMHPFISVKSETDFTLNETFFSALDWAVKNALANNLMAILDFHSSLTRDPFTRESISPLSNKTKFLACWEQIAEHCKNYPDEVLFEICNEPSMEASIWNEMHSDAYKILRKSNPKRTIVIGPRIGNRIQYLQDLILPENDRNIIVAIHYYNPHNFTHQGAPWSAMNKDFSGIEWPNTESGENAIISEFDMAREWSEKNDRPLTLGEFGAYEKGDMDSRVRWTSFVARQAEARGWSWSYWQFDDDFIVYDIDKGEWVKPIYDALIPKMNK